MKIFLVFAMLVSAFTLSTFGQTSSTTSLKLEQTPAFKFLVEQKSKTFGELKQLRTEFTEKHPTVQSKKTEIEVLDLEIAKLYSFEPAKYSLLSKCYGELIVQKVQAEADVKKFLTHYTMKHPDLQAKVQVLTKLEAEIANYFK